MRKRYNLYIGEKTIESLQKLAKRDDTTVSELIRMAIKATYGTNRPSVPLGNPQNPA